MLGFMSWPTSLFDDWQRFIFAIRKIRWRLRDISRRLSLQYLRKMSKRNLDYCCLVRSCNLYQRPQTFHGLIGQSEGFGCFHSPTVSQCIAFCNTIFEPDFWHCMKRASKISKNLPSFSYGHKTRCPLLGVRSVRPPPVRAGGTPQTQAVQQRVETDLRGFSPVGLFLPLKYNLPRRFPT